MKTKLNTVSAYEASDGSLHKTLEALERKELFILLCSKIYGRRIGEDDLSEYLRLTALVNCIFNNRSEVIAILDRK